MVLVGVGVVAGAGALEEMARCLVEEYVRAGWEADRLLALFRNPFYRTLHVIHRQLGEDCVRRLVTETAARWRGCWIREESGDA